MRVPSYRKHSSGQARVTINGKDHLLGKYGTPESKQAYGRLIAEYSASGHPDSFGKSSDALLFEDVLLAYLRYAKAYYKNSSEFANFKLVVRPLAELYGNIPASSFGVKEFKAVRNWWLTPPAPQLKKNGEAKNVRSRTRQYVNKQMKRTLRIIRWAVSEGMVPAEAVTALQCVQPLQMGRCEAKEAPPVTCVDEQLVSATLEHLTPVLADMVRFQQLTGCRPGEVCSIKPAMVDRSSEVWTVSLVQHKTAHRGKDRIIYVGPKAQKVLESYLEDREPDSYCFSPIESERQRRALAAANRATPMSCGNRPGTNVARKPRKQPGECYDTQSYGKAMRNACKRANLETWSPNQLRHNAATEIRKQFGLDAASVILGHSEVGVTQVYAEADKLKAIDVASRIG
ncbi:MAG TPA: integrase [Planctomycetaceae bacterium]|nr:integrase [Planctomycetaceae bacterium]